MVKIGITVSLVAFLISSVSAEIPLYGQCQVGATSCGTKAKCVAATTTYAQCLPAEEPFEDIVARAATSLNDGFVAKGKKYWGTCSDSALLNNAQNAAVIKTHFGALTPENSMKWDSTESSKGNFNYAGGDTLVKWAKDNDKLVRGHCLVWHSQLPGWVSNIRDKATLTSTIQNHATTLVKRWPGLYAWDVVNEALNEDGSYRSSVFYQVLGDSFFKIAFQAARDADPTVKLYYNDYNLDSNNAKVRGAVKIAGLLNSGGTNLLDGLGTQSHLEANGAGGVQAALTALAAAPGSPDVAITELDIKGASANDYVTVAKACLAVEKCVGITVWGVRDNDSWRSGNSPLLFNGSFQPKPALTAILNIL